MKIIKKILLLLSLLFIYFMSYLNGESSSNLSNGLLLKIYFFLRYFIVIDKDIFFMNFTNIIRESAHFAEFMIFGFLLYWNIKDYISKRKILVCFVIGLLIAISDETLQLFIDGRSFQLLDISIDSFGCYFGTLIFHLICKNNERINA